MMIGARMAAWNDGAKLGHYLSFQSGSYFQLNNPLTILDKTSVSFIGKVMIPDGLNHYFLDCSIRHLAPDNIGFCLGTSEGKVANNFKLNGNDSTGYFNPENFDITDLFGEWVKLESGFEVISTGVRTFWKINDEVVTEKTSSETIGTGVWESSMQIGNGNFITSSGETNISWIEIVSDGVVKHRFEPTEDLTMIDTVGGVELVKVGSGFEYKEYLETI